MKFRKKLVVVEAQQFENLTSGEAAELAKWCNGEVCYDIHSAWIEIPKFDGII